VKNTEIEILNRIGLRIIIISAYQFIKTYVYDFFHNNEDKILSLNLKRHLDNLEYDAIFFSKVMMHSEEFLQYKSSSKAMASLILAFDSVRSNSINLSSDQTKLIKNWVNLI
jgi:hypothetical protein